MRNEFREAEKRGCAFIIDDHQLVRDGLRRLLEDHFNFSEVREASCLEDALGLLPDLAAIDLIIVDLHMPGASGPEALPALAEAVSDARIAVISGSEERDDILRSIAAGVDGYIPKSLGVPEMIQAIERILGGEIFVPRSVARRGAPPPPPRPRRAIDGVANLTDRQREVLDELLQGKASKEIARSLNVAEGTVKIHLAAIYRVLGVRSRGEAIARLSSSN